jgi:hypothetical protein
VAGFLGRRGSADNVAGKGRDLARSLRSSVASLIRRRCAAYRPVSKDSALLAASRLPAWIIGFSTS